MVRVANNLPPSSTEKYLREWMVFWNVNARYERLHSETCEELEQ